MNEELKEYLKKISNGINIKLKEEEISSFFKYMELLLEWNEKINLTAITDKKDIILKHFIDSLTIRKYINQNENVLDIGTGAGFPGIPLSIVNTKNNFTLVDSLNKRINFLNIVKEELNLKNVNTIHSRAEDLGKDKKYREQYDIVTSRAVANQAVLSEYLLPFVKLGGYCICMKGANIEEEIKNSKFAIKTLGGKIEKIEHIKLPDSDFERNIIVIKKERKTENTYPRKAGVATKNPLVK